MGFFENKEYTRQEIKEIAEYIKEKVTIKPRIGIICGSGLGSLGETLTQPQLLDYKDIPNFPLSTVTGHAGRLLFGHIQTTPVMCMQGRFHFYEGYSLSTCTMPIRLMKLLGVEKLIVSNAAGGVNPSFKTGDVMFIKDHINFMGMTGQNPLRGSNEFGERFQAMNRAYDPEFIQIAKDVADNLKMKGVREGVYACVSGPNFETVAEVKMLRVLGVDAVGMSTTHEIVAARNCGLKCLALSLITNECVADYNSNEQPDGDEVVRVAEGKKEDLKVFMEQLVPILENKD